MCMGNKYLHFYDDVKLFFFASECKLFFLAISPSIPTAMPKEFKALSCIQNLYPKMQQDAMNVRWILKWFRVLREAQRGGNIPESFPRVWKRHSNICMQRADYEFLVPCPSMPLEIGFRPTHFVAFFFKHSLRHKNKNFINYPEDLVK